MQLCRIAASGGDRQQRCVLPEGSLDNRSRAGSTAQHNDGSRWLLCYLFHSVVRLLATPDTLGAFYKGLRLMALDSTVLDVPDSQANAAAFGYPKGGAGPAPSRRCAS